MKQIIEKIFAFILLCIILISSCSNTVLALTEISNAYLQSLGKAQYHLKYYKEDKGIYSYVICTVVGHYYHGNFCPAYCLDKTLDGVGDVGSYTVDFTEMIKNEKLWRVIKNGYPYRKANEMGLSSDYDAYAVTKFAVYCVTGQSNLDYFYAEDDDYEAKAMLAELKRLVNTGNNGSESQTKNLKVVKSADFAEDGDYYSVKYKIESDVSISNYKVKNITGFPDGTIVTDSYGSPKSTFSGGEQFKIRIPKSKLNSDISGKISVEAEGKIYPIFYGKTRQAGTQNYVTVADSNGLLNAETTFKVSLNNSKVVIQKKDTDTKKPIAGVTFALMDSNKKTIKTGVTNSAGELEFSGLYQGKYYVKETKTTDNYELNGEERPVNLEYNKSFTVLMFNKHKTGNLKIIKTDKDKGTPIANVTFELYSEEENKVIRTYTTNEKGEINDTNLRTGKYTLTEKNTDKWYKPIENKQIEIKANSTTEVKVQNELKKGNAKIEKVDSENTSIKIPNVKFEIFDQNMKKLEEITTNNQGVAYTSQYAVRDYQKLYIKEKEANSAYKLDTKTYEVTLKENSTSNITISNLRKKGQIKVIKVDKDNNEIFLEGVEFKVQNSKGQVVDTITTNSKGEAITKELPLGEEYTVIETKTKQNYAITKDVQKIKLEKEEIETLKFENEKKKGTIKVIKVDKDNNNVFLQGVEFNVLDSKGNVVDHIVTNEKGEATSKRLPIDENYTVVETKTRQNYILTQTPQTAQLKENQTTTLKFQNEKRKGKIKVVKVDKDNNEVLLDGVEFNIKNSKGEVVDTIITNQKGEAESKSLPIDEEYSVVETKTKENYALNNVPQKAKLEENKTTTLKFENEKKKGTIKVIKVDKDNNEIPLEGVEFNIMNSKGDIVDTIVTNEAGEAQSKRLSIDEEYKIIETKTKENYILNKEPQTAKLKENEITTLKFENEKRKGKIKVIKVDKDNNEVLLEGIEFNILNSKEDVVGVLVTNEAGEAESENLPIDEEYTVVETKTKENYVLNNEPQKVQLEENKISTLKFENEKKKGTIKIIKVDKDNNEVFLEGVEFNILNSAGTIVDTVTTNEKGEAESIRLPIDDEYSAIETKTKDVYLLNNEPQTAKLAENQITALKFENEKRKGKIKVIKVDKDNNEILLDGVEFNIFNSNGEIVDIISTNEAGEAESKDLSIDDEYTVIEAKTKENYVLSEESQKAKVEENEITTLKFENEKKKGKIQIIKVDKDDNKVFLEGVKFNILNSQEEIVDTVITNEKGEAESKNLPIDDKYVVIETETLEKYLLTEEPQTAELEENEITTLTFENEKRKGQLKIVKKSKDDNVGTGEKAGTPLKDVEFEVYDEKNKVIENLKTDEEGIATTSRLPLGNYKVKETKTGEWYILDEEYHNAKISENDEIVVLNLKNESVKPNVELEKTGQEKAEPDEEIKYEFDIKNTSNTKLDNFEFVDKIPTDYIKVDKVETGTYKNADKYDIYYKSNMTKDYVLVMEDLPSTENHQVDFKKELADNEYVTEIKFDFKTVDTGFKAENSPQLYAKVNEDVKSEDTFVNESYVGGEYKGYKVTDESKWKTMCYKVLPLTGM